jgi:hypothetical protein
MNKKFNITAVRTHDGKNQTVYNEVGIPMPEHGIYKDIPTLFENEGLKIVLLHFEEKQGDHLVLTTISVSLAD